jgi:hypothetical protein
MPEYQFINTQTLIYAERGLHAEPGETYDWPDGAPADGMWVPAGNEPAPEPADTTPDPFSYHPAEADPVSVPAPVTDAPKTEEV